MRFLLLLGLVVLLIAVATAPVRADQGGTPDASADFGQHVRDHAQSGHLDGEHNPGNHQGASNWEEHTD